MLDEFQAVGKVGKFCDWLVLCTWLKKEGKNERNAGQEKKEEK